MYLVADNGEKTQKLCYGNAQELEALYNNNKPIFDGLYKRIWIDKGKKEEIEPKIFKELKK